MIVIINKCIFALYFYREKPKDVEWNELAKLKTPLLLNFSQCRLNQADYYRVIECCTEVLQYDQNNLKALYRRGKAHVGAWNPEKAEEDFNRCVELDQNLKTAITKEIASLNEKIRSYDEKSKNNLKKLF